MDVKDGIKRVVVEGVSPEIEGGRFPAKGIQNDKVIIEADIFADGHDVLSAFILYRRANEKAWTETPMQLLVNDRWRGSFTTVTAGLYVFTITAWVDKFKTWVADIKKRIEAGQKDIDVNLQIGAGVIRDAAGRAPGDEGRQLSKWAETLEVGTTSRKDRVKLALSAELTVIMQKYTD